MPTHKPGRLVHPITTNESVSAWLGISRYEAHILMHAIDEAYIVHSREFTLSVLGIADALLDSKGWVETKTNNGIKYTYVKRTNNDLTTLIFNWTDHTFYIASVLDFILFVEEK